MAFVTIGAGPSPRKSDVEQTMAQVADTATGAWYILPNGMDAVSVSIIPATTGKIQHTLDIAGAVATSPTAVGIDWDPGDVTEGTTQLLRGGGAIRIVSISGVVDGFIRGVSD